MADIEFSSNQLTSMADEMAAFMSGLRSFLEVSQATPMMAILNSWEVPDDGSEAEWQKRRDQLDVLAGSAQYGIEVSKSYIASRDEHGAPVVLNLVASWSAMTQPKAMFDRSDLTSVAQQAEGRLRHLSGLRALEEKSFAGRVASLVRFPGRVRDLAGLTPKSIGGRTTEWTLSALIFTLATGVAGSFIWALILLVLKIK